MHGVEMTKVLTVPKYSTIVEANSFNNLWFKVTNDEWFALLRLLRITTAEDSSRLIAFND